MSNSVTLLGTAFFCKRGVIAGCAIATTWAKVVLVNGLDSFCQQYRDRAVDIGVYVDDIVVAATACRADVLVATVREAANCLHEFVVDELQGSIAREKAATFGSSPSLARDLRIAIVGEAVAAREPVM